MANNMDSDQTASLGVAADVKADNIFRTKSTGGLMVAPVFFYL